MENKIGECFYNIEEWKPIVIIDENKENVVLKENEERIIHITRGDLVGNAMMIGSTCVQCGKYFWQMKTSSYGENHPKASSVCSDKCAKQLFGKGN